MLRICRRLFVVFVVMVSVATGILAEDVNDASGVFVSKNELLIVGNRDNRKYFRYPLKVIPAVSKVRRLEDDYEESSVDKRGEDLEDIGPLNGEYVALSEENAEIVGKQKVLIKYQSKSKEWPVVEDDDGRGLEGLAIWERDKDSSDIAVSWEGGHGRSPRIYIHSVSHKAVATKNPIPVDVSSAKRIKLATSSLRKLTGQRGSFRVPALVFSPDGKNLIVLLSQSGNKWLMRFDRVGNPIGGIRTLSSLGLSSEDLDRNWEGLAWWGPDKLVLVSDNDDGRDGTTRIFVAQLPIGW